MDVERRPKTGRLVAIESKGPEYMCRVWEFSDDLSEILKVRQVKRPRTSDLESTDLVVEIEVAPHEFLEGKVRGRLVRVLRAGELSLADWSDGDLQDLPVAPSMGLTSQERRWAGEHEAQNENGGCLLGLAGIAALGALVLGYELVSLAGGVAAVLLWRLYPWEESEPIDPERLARLDELKRRLIAEEEAPRQSARLEFERALSDFGAWEALTPLAFEEAVMVWLEANGMKLVTTPRTGDKGIDLEGVDESGVRVAIQVKQLGKNVQERDLREFQGALIAKGEAERALFVALNGYSRGAKRLSEEAGIELVSVRDAFVHPDASAFSMPLGDCLDRLPDPSS